MAALRSAPVFGVLAVSLALAGCDTSKALGAVRESTDDSSGAPTDGGTDELLCAEGLIAAGPPTCDVGAGPAILEPGCHASCSDDSGCAPELRCELVWYSPCSGIAGDEDCSATCGQTELCVPAAFDATCASIVGKAFRSIEEHECGAGQGMTVTCHWSIEFAVDGNYLWKHSDVGDGGTYACADGELTSSAAVAASFDLATGILTWDGIEYEAVILPPG